MRDSFDKARKMARYALEVNINGKVPKRKDRSGAAEIIIGKAVSFWEGFTRQIFGGEKEDKRTITFKLVYLNSGKKLPLVERTYPYSEKFMGYFGIAGFSEMLAWDILVEGPYQWDLSVFAKNNLEASEKGTKDKKNVVSKNKKDKEKQKENNQESTAAILDITSSIVDIELNRNFQIVKPLALSKSVFLASTSGIGYEKKNELDIDILSGNLLRNILVFDLDELPDYTGVFLSVGEEPYTRYYTHKRVDYLLRKLEKLDLTFYFADSTFGVSQLLATNDELSYAGARYARGVAEDPQPFDTFYNVDLALNKGVLTGLKMSFDLWPESSQKEIVNDDIEVETSIKAYRILLGYKYSFLLPLVGAIDLTPTLGIWNYQITSKSAFQEFTEEESAAPTLGLRVGYTINVFDFLLSGYGKFSRSFGGDAMISSTEFGADLGYQLSNVYAMRTLDPAIYGFVAFQDFTIEENSEEGGEVGIEVDGLVIGAGFSLVWE